MKKITTILALSVLLASNAPMYALTFKTCATACAAVAAGTAAGTVIGRGIAAYRNKMRRKRIEWIDNFIALPLAEPCTPLELRLAMDEMKRMLTASERLYVVHAFLHAAHGLRNTPQESEKGLRLISRACDILLCTFTQKEIRANNWICPLQAHALEVMHCYAQGHDENSYAAAYAKACTSLTQAMCEGASVVCYMKSKGNALYEAVQSKASAMTRAVHAGAAKIVA